VPLKARSARHGWNLLRWADPHLEHFLPFQYAVTSTGGDNRNAQQRVLITVVPTCTGAAQHTRLRVAVRERPPDVPEPAALPYTNSITVHAFPTSWRLVSVATHTGTVSQSCFGPDNMMVFTICYCEEAMKMWKVWGCQEEVGKKESVFDSSAFDNPTDYAR